jgi:hypothetical protein
MDPFDGELRNPLSLHKYQYAGLDPINAKDPSGEFTLAERLVVSTLIGTVGAGVGALYAQIKGGSAIRGAFYGFTIGFTASFAFFTVISYGVGAAGAAEGGSLLGSSAAEIQAVASQFQALVRARGLAGLGFSFATAAATYVADAIALGVYDSVVYVLDQINGDPAKP